MRTDGRTFDEFRVLRMRKNYLKFAEGSCLIELGNTKVICSASVEEDVPGFLKNSGGGWITAEYGMLPRSCQLRIPRESSKGKIGGRTHEIQRLIGRSLRAVADLSALGKRTIWIDCDVLQGDGGTRTASITGSFIALYEALTSLMAKGIINTLPLNDYVGAISVGILKDAPILDLTYEEDSSAEVDMNIVMTGKGKLVEVQGTAEHEPFSVETLNQLIALAQKGIVKIIGLQNDLLKWKAK
ncbi:MAG: ribonuclease PH [Candidatus Omnitrophica bacterium]|nr:ribonuclease PH [Candidatus Omnitrophota bacterium]